MLIFCSNDRLKALIEDCWSEDDAARPPFSIIVKRLDTILIDIAVLDTQANTFWKKYFPTRVSHRYGISLLGIYLPATCPIRTKRLGKISLTSSVGSWSWLRASTFHRPSAGSAQLLWANWLKITWTCWRAPIYPWTCGVWKVWWQINRRQVKVSYWTRRRKLWDSKSSAML